MIKRKGADISTFSLYINPRFTRVLLLGYPVNTFCYLAVH
jgi:hypothetical protein